VTQDSDLKRHSTDGFVAGRKQEVRLFREMVSEKSPYSVLNIYGPGGIGKSVVAHLFEARCAEWEVPYASVRGDDLTASGFEELLRGLRSSFGRTSPELVKASVFRDFDKRLVGYQELKKVRDSGEVNRVFDAAGRLVSQAPLKAALELLQGTYEGLEAYLAQKDNFQRYLDGADTWLTQSFVKSIDLMLKKTRRVVLLIDTYELMAGWDHWLCQAFGRGLPTETKVVILGRDKLGLDWSETHKEQLHAYELHELGEAEAKDYLRHHGLQDEAALNRIYAFTGGYPLCLTLAVELAKDNLGMNWERVQGLQNIADRAQIASQLLERILKQTAVREVREFLEKGVIVEWFDPEAVSYVLELDAARGAEIYETITQFSFVQRHPRGAKFHDRVRELLLERLRFNNPGEYKRLAARWLAYLRRKAGF
jgi:hypothetical protein